MCVHFAGANPNRVLVAALESMEWVILVPAEVCDEIVRKDAKYPGLRKRWLALERSDRIRVLPALEIGSAPARIYEHATRTATVRSGSSFPCRHGECPRGDLNPHAR